jgi:hypothetical protein
MQDLKTGNGLPPPANNPLELSYSHGWLRERVDLARVALYELLRRDRLGQLSPADRHTIDEMALANLTSQPFTTPVQCYLDEELSNRLITGKLTPEEQAAFYQRALLMELAVRTEAIRGMPVPVRVRFQAFLPDNMTNNTGWEIVTTYKALRIDGRPAQWSARFAPEHFPQYRDLSGGWDTHDDRTFDFETLGQHEVELDVLAEFYHGTRANARNGLMSHWEKRTLKASFEVVDASPDGLVQRVDNADLVDDLSGRFLVRELTYRIEYPGSFEGYLDVSALPVNIAFDLFARYNGKEWPIGHVTRSAHSPVTIMSFASDPDAQPIPRPPPTVDLIFRSNPRVALTTVDMDHIWNGQIVLKQIPTTPRSLR